MAKEPSGGAGQDTPVQYMERTRNYYRALGYEQDYVWAHHDEVAFTPPAKPVAEMTVALITTAGPPDNSNRDANKRRQIWSGAVAGAPSRFTTDHAWDKETTHTDDRETFLPIDAVKRLIEAGEVGGLAARFHGAATVYSHRQTREQDAPELLRRVREDGADAVILTAL